VLDPRIEDNIERIKELKEAVKRLADYVDSLAWRVGSPEERDAGITIAGEIRKLLEA